MDMLGLNFKVFMVLLLLEEPSSWKPLMLADFNLIEQATTCFVACSKFIN